MITPEGQPVLLDFGLARDTSPPGDVNGEGSVDASKVLLTREGDVFGTLYYMAPEQLRGESAQLDARADVWALGITLYEALVGERPFSGKTPLQVAESIEFGKLSDPRSRNSALTPDVGVVVGMALERNRDRRYGSALALAEDLRRIVEYEPILARPAGPMLRLGRWCRREPAWAAALAVTLLALIGGLIATQMRLAERSRLLNKSQASLRASAVQALEERATAGALALGLQTVELDDTWLNRSTLYSPLLATTLLRTCAMPNSRVWDAHYLSDTHLLVGSVGGTVAIFDVGNARVVALAELSADVESLAVTPDRSLAFAGLKSGEVVGLALPAQFKPVPQDPAQAARFRPASIEVLWRRSLSTRSVGDLVAGADRVYGIMAPNAVSALDVATGVTLASFTTGGDELARLELSAGADRLVVADTIYKRRGMPGRSRSVTILDTENLTPVAVLEHVDEVIDFDLANSADVLATVGERGLARLFDTRTGVQIHTEVELSPPAGHLVGTAVALAPDGQRIAIGFSANPATGGASGLGLAVDSAPSTCRVFSLGGPSSAGVPPSWTSPSVVERVTAIEFSSDGSRVAVSDVSNHVRVFAALDGTSEQVHTERQRMTDLRFAPGGSMLASFGVSRLVYLWRVERSSEAFWLDSILPGDARPVTWGEFCVDGARVAAMESGGRAAVFAAPSIELSGGKQGTGAPGVRPPGVGPPKVGAPEPGALLFRIDGCRPNEEAPRARVSLSSSGELALWVDPDRGHVRVIELNGGGCLRELDLEGWAPGEIRALVIEDGLAHGFTAVLVDARGTAWVVDAESAPEALRDAGTPEGWMHCRILPRVGAAEAGGLEFPSLLVAASLDEIVAFEGHRTDATTTPLSRSSPTWTEKIFEAPELSPTAPRGFKTWVHSPDGKELVLATTLGRVYRWECVNATLVETRSFRRRIDWLWYLDRDRVVVAADGPGTNRILGGAEEVVPLAQHASPIRSMAVGVEAGVVVTGSEKGSVLMWDAETGAPLARARVHEGAIRSVATHGERGRLRVLSCGQDGATVLPLDVVGAARRVTSRQLSDRDRSDVETILGGG
ncbi:MAG: WD40 repeat protein [Planctomycetota bacterium]|jgi:WD40 repeat protein